MGQEPWEEKIVKEENKISRKAKMMILNTHWLTAILSIFFTIMLIILFIVFYTSNRGGNKVKETSGFYKTAVSKKQTKKNTQSSSVENANEETSTEESTEEETTESSSKEGTGDTIVVLAGEGAGSIAARAGISVAQLQSLNPAHMTQGYWYANPGDAVYVN
ncbi:MAG: LysM domain-containing protein [Streptococcus sp.]|nr:LysM domain-containing protein [Streptococcus sp.]